MKIQLFLVALAISAVSGRYLVKRDNSYGDEPVVPAEVATEAPAAVSAESDEGYAAPAEAVTEAPAAEEYAPAEVAQEVATEAPAVEASGYRLKRQAQNAYGDEPVVPEEPATEAPVVEEAVATDAPVSEEAPATEAAPAAEGTEAPVVATTAAAAAEEYAPVEVAQEVATEAPAVEASGYRL